MIRLYADYRKPIVEALVVLEDSHIDRFPVDLMIIQHQYKNLFEIKSYGEVISDSDISREAFYRCLGSKDGAVVFDGCSKYIIYYNEKQMQKRIRFTIAHEIGHIMLDHHQEYGKPILAREGIGPQLYKRLENEASCFARNLLCPAYHTEKLLAAHGITRVSYKKGDWQKTKESPVTENLKVLFDAATLIENAFNVSATAAETRMDLLNTDITKYNKYGIDWKPTSHIKQTAAWVCSLCGLERFKGSTYCSECRHEHFSFQVKNPLLQYRGAEINDELQFSPCPVCGNSDISAGAGFCRMCGTPFRNFCTGDPAHINHPEANYCYACGKPTAFNGTEYHNRVKQSVQHIPEGDLSMKYESDIKYDPNTYKVKECPRCNNEIFSDDANFCQICGLELVNICMPEPVEDSTGEYYTPEPHINLPGARFCETCGAPTVYFQKHRILESYQKIQGIKEPVFDEDIPF